MTPPATATTEEVLDPDLPICDAHHHLWDDAGHTGTPYPLATLLADTASGHRVLRTVFVECHAHYLVDGPVELRPVGEVRYVAAAAERSATLGGAEIAAIVGHADLALGAPVGAVLDALDAAGGGRFRGVRHTTAHDPSPMNNAASRAGLMADDDFRRGVDALGARGHSFDAFCFHPQLDEFAALARACAGTTIVLNHLGVPIAGGPYRGRSDEVRAHWRSALRHVAGCPNVVVKLGGITRPLSGDRWDRRGVPASSQEIVAAWGDDIRFVIDTFGPARCMFESNFPVDASAVGYVALWNAFKQIAAPFTAAERVDLFHDTAARAYRLPTVS